MLNIKATPCLSLGILFLLTVSIVLTIDTVDGFGRRRGYHSYHHLSQSNHGNHSSSSSSTTEHALIQEETERLLERAAHIRKLSAEFVSTSSAAASSSSSSEHALIQQEAEILLERAAHIRKLSAEFVGPSSSSSGEG